MFRWYDHVIMDDASVVKRMGLASDRCKWIDCVRDVG